MSILNDVFRLLFGPTEAFKLTRISLAPPTPQGPSTPVATLGFDPDQELLWAGNEYGRISSHFGPELTRYTSIRAHPPNDGSVRQLLFHERGVISIASRSVHLTARQGLTQWHLTHPEFMDLRCMSFTTSNSQILVAGCQKSMFMIDVEKGQIIEKVSTDWNYTIMRKSRHICAATDNGSVNVLDPGTFEILKSWKAHGTAINDMDAHNDFLVTCGYSVRQTGQPIVDPLANVYDLKQMKPIAPIPFHAGAAFVRLLPNMQTTAIVASQTGQLQLVDLMNPNTVNLRQVNISSYMLMLDMAPSGQALVVADSEGNIHLWGSPSKIRFSILNKETEFASPPQRATFVDWNNTPLSAIGMPYYHEKLLSAWPSHMVFEVGAPPPQVDPSIIPHLRPFEMGQFAPNPRRKLRNQVENTRVAPPSETALAAPKFLSEKAREQPVAKIGRRVSDAAEALAGASLDVKSEEDLLLKYSNVEIKYSKFGVEDFDFKFYNKTAFSGLETHISNSFTNSLLQLFKFIPLIRNLALHHAATNCVFEPCILCELGFLFDMLDKANGQNCQATNLLKTFSSYREAVTLGLLEENLASKSLSATIQAVNRFFLGQMSHDFRQTSPNAPDADQILATGAAEAIRCMYCRTETNKPGEVFVHELFYPQDHKPPHRNLRFSQLLKASIERETHNRGWCSKCRRYQQLALRKTVKRMPLVLMINAALNNPAYRYLWATPGWLPAEIGILVDGGHVFCFEGEDLRLRMRNNPDLILYDLVGFVSEIDIHEHQKPHLVSFINVNISSNDFDNSSQSEWHLFNDFLVAQVKKEEAMTFGQSWKMPCVLAYQVQTARHAVDDSWKDSLDTTLLYYEWSMNNGRPIDTCHVLDAHVEAPAPGTHIALDTEFVDLEKAEIDVKADGSQETVRPSKSGLARVSVLRGNGDSEGVPFIDDYIVVKDTIVDYVTQYSGIRPGDLDPRTSTKNLVPLKVAYKKLWLLLNLGCVFVGHGLASDFRKINIKVPKEQTVDTQYLFFHPGKNRRLSLRYLAWAVFKEYIQEDGGEEEGHDSIEDARMALRLWKKFLEYEDAGVVNQMLEEIFREGLRVGFKPPPRRKDGEIGTPGRNTPEFGGRSGPGTPSRGFRLSQGASGSGLNPGGDVFRPGSGLGQFGSPLR